MNKFIFIGAADKTDLLLHCAELLSLLADVNVLLVDATTNGNYQNIFGFEKGGTFDYYGKFDITTVGAFDGLNFNAYDICIIDADVPANLCMVMRTFNEPDEETKIFCVSSFKVVELLPLKLQIKSIKEIGCDNMNHYSCVFYDVPYKVIEPNYVLSELFGQNAAVMTYELLQTDGDRDLIVSEQHNGRVCFKRHSKLYRACVIDISSKICNANADFFKRAANKIKKKNI